MAARLAGIALVHAAIASQTRSLIYSNLGITVMLAATFLAALKLA